MITKYSDYNGADNVISTMYLKDWEELETVLTQMPLHIKSSDQAGRLGSWIFNPVGTNFYIKEHLQNKKWFTNIAIPDEYNFLGIDVDFCKKGILAEVQFSNYPFLLNNLVRSELFYKSKTAIGDQPTNMLIIITKAHMFPASNSTLYYEQAVKQIDELSRNNVFDIPIRVVGLYEQINKEISVKVTKYDKTRYSRRIAEESMVSCILKSAHSEKSRCIISI